MDVTDIESNWCVVDDGEITPEWVVYFKGNGENDHVVSVYLPEPVESSINRLQALLREHWPNGSTPAVQARDAAIRASACEFHELMRNDLQQILGLEPRASWLDVKNAVKRLVEERAND